MKRELVLAFLLAAMWPAMSHADNASSSPGTGLGEEPFLSSQPGPWGHLKYFEVPLSAPEHYLRLITLPTEETEWNLPAIPPDEIYELLVEAGVTALDASALIRSAGILADEEITRLYPTREFLASLSMHARATIYRALASYPENTFHRRPYYFNTSNLSDWFEGTDIRRATIYDTSTLAYPTPSGRGYFFSDFPHLLKRSFSQIEERAMLRALTRQHTLLVRLDLSDAADLEQLAGYWASRHRNRNVMPMIQSVIENPHPSTLDIIHFLPPIPRRTLNRYPDAADGLTGRYPDWFWTCYNFFHYAAKHVYADSPERDEILETEFVPGELPHEFGDCIILESRGDMIHGCIYVADDIVYTKNGSDLLSPWVLMKLEDVVAYHDIQGDVTLSHFRKKALEPTP